MTAQLTSAVGQSRVFCSKFPAKWPLSGIFGSETGSYLTAHTPISPRAKGISGPEKFWSSPQKDFFNTIGTFRTSHDVRLEVTQAPVGTDRYKGRPEARAATRAFPSSAEAGSPADLGASSRRRTRSAHSRSIMSAIALMRLLAYFGSPALSESPLLKELLPMSSCAGTRFRRMGVLLYSFYLFSTSFLTATRM